MGKSSKRSRGGQAYYDHAFTPDLGHKFLKKLESFGFRLEKRMTEHPGKHYCRFIMFPSRSPRTRAYLEFIDIGRGGDPLNMSGLSFGWTDDLEKFHKTTKLRTTYEHKNYAWKEDSVSRLPGWNFVNFKGLGIRSFYPWVTEYEPHPKFKRKQPGKAHRNGVTLVSEFVFDVNAKGLRFFEAMAGKKATRQGALKELVLSDGTRFLFRSANSNRFRKVILKCDDLKKFRKRVGGADGDVTFDGREMVLIKNPLRGFWDILVTE